MAVALSLTAVLGWGQSIDEFIAGPAYSQFQLTLTSGYEREAVGPFYYEKEVEAQRQWALPPFYCNTRTTDVDWEEWEILYPLVDYRRFGPEYRLQILEFLSFSGENTIQTNGIKHTTLFPFYFSQRAPDTNLNYTAVVPFYGHLVNRLFRDDIKFIMFPAYSETRRHDVITDNYFYPFVDTRRGDHLKGWQVWPVVGVEHKAPTFRTNLFDQPEVIGGYDKLFAVWPFYFKDKTGIGTTNEAKSLTIVPFYSRVRSPSRDEISYGWPFGYNIVDEHEKHYIEHSLFWPLFVRAHGTKTETRIFPFYSHAANEFLSSDFYLWPVYKSNRLQAPPLDRRRTRILFFLYSDIRERNSESGELFRRVDFWPFYTYHHEMNGDQRLQVASLVEPFFPNNRTIVREYGPIWSFWKWERNAKTGATSQSLFWNLYRHETTPEMRKTSLFFGLIRYQVSAQGEVRSFGPWTPGRKPAQMAQPKD